MNINILLSTLLLIATNSYAEIMNCNLSENALFPMINLDTESKSAVMTDRYGKNTNGKITLVRKLGQEKNKFNVAFEYRINNVPTHIDLIVIPTNGETYKVGMAGYVEKDKKKILDITSSDDAMCF